MNIESHMYLIWLSVFVIAFVLEAITQDFVSIWFAIGALIAVIISFFAPFWVEIIVFVVVSVASLICTRPLVKKFMDRTARKTNTDEFLGRKVKVIKTIDKFDGGTIKLNGIEYTAILMEEDEESIPEDSIVEVVSMRGNRAVVRKIIEEESTEEEK